MLRLKQTLVTKAEKDVVAYTNGSVIRNRISAWTFSACTGGRIDQEASGAFAMITHICILSDSLSHA
jgi:hypothetical protein